VSSSVRFWSDKETLDKAFSTRGDSRSNRTGKEISKCAAYGLMGQDRRRTGSQPLEPVVEIAGIHNQQRINGQVAAHPRLHRPAIYLLPLRLGLAVALYPGVQAVRGHAYLSFDWQ
jgi:hypothetical protein